jgi:hypothetical protein
MPVIMATSRKMLRLFSVASPSPIPLINDSKPDYRGRGVEFFSISAFDVMHVDLLSHTSLDVRFPGSATPFEYPIEITHNSVHA